MTFDLYLCVVYMSCNYVLTDLSLLSRPLCDCVIECVNSTAAATAEVFA